LTRVIELIVETYYTWILITIFRLLKHFD